jgi:A/G-specific adenine glycosylase
MRDGEALRAWYRPRREAYPWRRGPQVPYRTLVSEVMLQQTQAARVIPAYPAFLRRFPSIRALARASAREVLGAWAGLGYNRRALALRQAARVVVRDHRGRIPDDPRTLAELPGVGAYTAAAVASIGHGVPVPAIDTNAARVIARAALGREAHEVPRARLQRAAWTWLDRSDPGAWNQAVMDLGREVCRPMPRCAECPMSARCRFRRKGRPARRPRPRQSAFEGSRRQLRGGIVAALLQRDGRTTGSLASALGEPIDRVTEAVRSLAGDGLLRAGSAALAGRPGGRIRLPG